MKKILYILLSVVAVSCTKVDIYDTDHPGQGKLTLETDWNSRTAGVVIPASYTAESAGLKVTLSGTTVEYPNLLDPDTYTLNLYNTADKITVSGTVATVAAEGAGVAPLPGCQFFGTVTTTIEQDKDHSATVVMKQLTRDLSFDLTITEGKPDRIATITATLSGIAPSWDCTAGGGAGAPTGTATTVAPAFTLTGNKLTASVRLLGITGTAQVLTLDLIFKDGKTQQIVSPVTSQLVLFNIDKHLPITLTGDVQTPVSTDQNGSITNWIVINGGDITAN